MTSSDMLAEEIYSCSFVIRDLVSTIQPHGFPMIDTFSFSALGLMIYFHASYNLILLLNEMQQVVTDKN